MLISYSVIGNAILNRILKYNFAQEIVTEHLRKKMNSEVFLMWQNGWWTVVRVD